MSEVKKDGYTFTYGGVAWTVKDPVRFMADVGHGKIEGELADTGLKVCLEFLKDLGVTDDSDRWNLAYMHELSRRFAQTQSVSR